MRAGGQNISELCLSIRKNTIMESILGADLFTRCARNDKKIIDKLKKENHERIRNHDKSIIELLSASETAQILRKRVKSHSFRSNLFVFVDGRRQQRHRRSDTMTCLLLNKFNVSIFRLQHLMIE